jgi:hypothetical protein
LSIVRRRFEGRRNKEEGIRKKEEGRIDISRLMGR